MIERNAGHLVVKVPMTIANARGLLDAGRSALQPGAQLIDLSAVTEFDSAAVALMLGWLRQAALLGVELKFSGVPPAIISLAEVYGVAELLPQA